MSARTRPRIMRPSASLSRNEAHGAKNIASCRQTGVFNRIGPIEDIRRGHKRQDRTRYAAIERTGLRISEWLQDNRLKPSICSKADRKRFAPGPEVPFRTLRLSRPCTQSLHLSECPPRFAHLLRPPPVRTRIWH